MGIRDELLALERAGWDALIAGRGGTFYERTMTADGLMVVPTGVISRDNIAASLDGVTPWERYEMNDAVVVELNDAAAVLTYRATANRPGQDAYRAHMTSVYVRGADGWGLAFHQQTPVA